MDKIIRENNEILMQCKDGYAGFDRVAAFG
jgi:hypothetical protein